MKKGGKKGTFLFLRALGPLFRGRDQPSRGYYFGEEEFFLQMGRSRGKRRASEGWTGACRGGGNSSEGEAL